VLFDATARSDATPARHDEERFAFLNRSASRYFGYVRELMEEWFSHVPAEAQADLRGALRADDRQSESAFWELYLHEAYLRGCRDYFPSAITWWPDWSVGAGEADCGRPI
jgi:hypothetical protein